MPPKTPSKQKPNAQQWNQCSLCEFIFLKSNNSNEDHECDSTKKSGGPLIFQNQFLGTLVEHSKDIAKDMQLSKEFLFDFLFLHPLTMKLSDFQIGECVVISQPDSIPAILTAVCWPLSNLDLGSFSLNRNYCSLNGLSLNGNDTILVSRPSNIQIASRVEIKLVKSLNSHELDEETDETELILSFLHETYLNKCVLPTQLLSVVYMGKKIIFKIETSSAMKNKKLNGSESLTNQLENLHINKKTATDKKFLDANLKPIINPKLLNPVDVLLIDSKTKFSLVTSKSKIEDELKNNEYEEKKVSFKEVGGLEKEIDLLKELFILPFEFREIYQKIGVQISKGVLLFGPGGCGKTMLARATLNDSKCDFVELKVSEIYSKNYGESEVKLKNIFNEAWTRAPCIFFIDEIDTLCGRRETLSQDLEKRIVSLFSNLMDQSKSKEILFLCTTNKIDSIDTALRRPGRFDKEIEIPIPNQFGRLAILRKQLNALNHSVTEQELQEIAQNCHGYVGADLQMLVQEAALIRVKLLMDSRSSSSSSSHDSIVKDLIVASDLTTALRKIKPSAMREITFDIPKVYWSQIGGQHDLKRKLQQAISWPIKHADSFKRLNVKAPRGLLMYGPPGCSKTMIAKALATETGLNFLAVKGPELFSKWVGESEKAVRDIFRKARNAAPAIIFFDEIDAVAVERSSSANKSNNVGDRVLAQILNEMDGVENLKDVTIVAATNRPDMIDKALMRPGRLDRIVYVSLPDESTRREIFELSLKQIPTDEDVDLDELVEKTAKYSGAEIAAVCNEAAFMGLEADINCPRLNMSHFEMALKMVTPRTSDQMISYFDNFSFNSGFHEI